jgi:hypothetical protein
MNTLDIKTTTPARVMCHNRSCRIKSGISADRKLTAVSSEDNPLSMIADTDFCSVSFISHLFDGLLWRTP